MEEITRVAPMFPSSEVPEGVATTRRAVIYLRVSSAGQVHTDRDAEGFSIPAQRDACQRKAAALGAQVVDEYVDAGESARSAARPGLQQMLRRLAEERDIDFVIVHKIDRLARNRVDDVNINLVIRQAGAQLVSVSENIDESPSGMLLQGIMSSIAEFYSMNLASEIKKGMTQKAKKGVHPSKAPVGYLNTREVVDGYEIRTIAIDPDRAGFVRWAFEAYATGEYSVAQLTEELAEMGLRSRPTAKRQAKPLSEKYVYAMLRNPFYIGIVTWARAQYEGTHEPLVSVETYAMVQGIMHSRVKKGEKSRRHNHFLKSTIYCHRCKSRMTFSRNRGRGGVYDYFVCLGRHQQRTDCTLPALQVRDVEDAIERYYANLTLTPESIAGLRSKLLNDMRRTTAVADAEAKRQRQRVLQLETERRRLLDAHMAGAVPLDLLREQQERLTRDLAQAGAALANTEVEWEHVEENLDKALTLVSRLQDAYLDTDDAGKRLFNQAIFDFIEIDTDGVVYARFAKPFVALMPEDLMVELEDIDDPDGHFTGRGSKESLLVEVMGLEPTTSTLRT